VINLRGEIIPVCDLSLALGLTASVDRAQIVICDTATDSVGFVVDEVLAVTTIEMDDLVAPASMSHPAMSGVIELDGALVMLLSLDDAVGGWVSDVREAHDSDAMEAA
jgi:chemotaxis signal transduction protein